MFIFSVNKFVYLNFCKFLNYYIIRFERNDPAEKHNMKNENVTISEDILLH